MITQRVHELRRQSLEAVNTLHHERALLATRFYRDHLPADEPIVVQRALLLKYILENKQVYIGKGELIVGERGPAPKATPTYPEICLHSIDDLDILHNRQKVSFMVSEETRKVYKEEIIPFWQGKTHRDRLMASMTDEWLIAYKAGVFTEFQEQRAPGHTVLGKKTWGLGMLDLIQQCENVGRSLSQTEENREKADQLRAMQIAAHSLIAYAQRHAEKLESLSVSEPSEKRREELMLMADICRRVPAHAPRTFREALQHYWFIHLAVITELNPWDSFNPGRLDQHLLPFYRKDILEGTTTPEQARECLHCFWIKFNNHPSPPKVGVTAQESNTYTDFALINLGGLTEKGEDAVNELSYLILEVIQEMRLLQPGSMIQLSKHNPDAFVHKALDIIKTGFGQPSIFNTDVIIEELTRQGKTLEDARNGGASGCVESGAFGCEAYMLTGYFNLPKILEITLRNGYDFRTKTRPGLETGDAGLFVSFEALLQAFRRQIHHFAEIKMQGNRQIEALFACHLPSPFLSLLIDDCIENGKDYNAGGARYNTSYIQGVGLGSVTDSLTALKHHVFENRSLSMNEMLSAISDNFQNYQNLRESLLYDTPKYGNDDPRADSQARQTFDFFFEAIDGKPCHRGGSFRINMLPTTSHIYFGSVCGASPDGRLAGKPLSEGISPVQGADRKGPTAILKSAVVFDHVLTGGTLLNQKFTPSFFNDSDSYKKLTALIRSYFRMNGHHIQFNVVSADTLRKAQKHPEEYSGLIVRVAGYSDYFNDLGEDLQNEIIARTEHGEET